MPYASVYPLVSARAVTRPYTYEVPDDVGKGAVVSVPFGAARRRGVVVELEQSPPPGVDALPVAALLGAVPAPLVDLALWLAEYYGSTPARALELVAPRARARRGERSSPVGRASLEAESEPTSLTVEQEAALAEVVGALDGDGGRFLLYGATGSGKTEVYLRACAAALERGLGAIVLVPEIALHCRACGVSRRCHLCDVALTLHGDGSLRCHHCGFSELAPATCPECGSPDLARIGAGTQKLERELAAKVPELEVIRLDADALERPGALHDALTRFAAT